MAFLITSSSKESVTHAQNRSAVPFDAQLTIKMFWPSGTVAFEKARHYARFSDGSTEFDVNITFPKQQYETTEILDVKTGEWIFLDALTQSKMTIKESPHDILTTISEMQEACPEGTDVAKLPDGGKILGFKTRYYLYPQEQDTSVKDEQWIASELWCFRLKRLETNLQDGTPNEEMATKVDLGEPATALLSPAPNFVERDPRTINQLHAAVADGQPFMHDPSLRMFEKLYSKGR